MQSLIDKILELGVDKAVKMRAEIRTESLRVLYQQVTGKHGCPVCESDATRKQLINDILINTAMAKKSDSAEQAAENKGVKNSSYKIKDEFLNSVFHSESLMIYEKHGSELTPDEISRIAKNEKMKNQYLVLE